MRKKCLACGQVYPMEVNVCASDGNGLAVILPDSMVGEKIGSWYTIVEELGKGGMGAIYKAHHGLMDRFVAIKLLLTDAGSDPNAMARFQVEARAASILSHPNIVKIFEFDITPEGLPFLIMEYLEGQTLQQLLQSRGRLAVDQALPKFISLCSALEHAHKRNVVHRDLKPSNMMLIADDDGSERIILVDFGIAKLFTQPGRNQRKLTQTGAMFGSPLYMSPEQCMGQQVNAKSDIYSLGCVMYETLTGVAPVDGENFLALVYAHINDQPLSFAQVCPDIALPPRLEAIVMRALAKSADERYYSMAELKRELESFQKEDPGHSPQSFTTEASKIANLAEIDLTDETNETNQSATENSSIDQLINQAKNGDADAQYELGYFYHEGQFVEQDYSKALYWFKQAAEAEHVAACYWTGTLYRDGKGVDEDQEQALHYFQRSANLGDDASQVMVAIFYEYATGVPKDLDLACYWYKKAAEKNNITAIKALARFYKYGDVGDIDLEKAAEYFLSAAEAGDIEAQLDVGYIYLNGQGLERNYEEAASWFLAAGQQGSAPAKRELAFCYLDGNGVPKDERESLRWLNEASAQSDADAQSYLAYFHQEGMAGLEPDPVAAFKWYSKAALKKHAWSQYRLGCMSQSGLGTPKNPVQAVAWFERAAEQGQMNAQYELALCYRDGIGAGKDLAAYELWLRKAADQGLAVAEYDMGVHCAEVRKNVRQAREWYEKAAEHGHQDAKTRLLQIGFLNERGSQ